MTDTHRNPAPDAFLAPWANLWQTPHIWASFGNCARAGEPLARSAACAQLELTSLVGNRARAWAAVPGTVARCRTPFDLAQAQFAFWQEAGRNYAEATQRMMAVWRGVLPADFAEGGAGVAPRDYITFPEPKSDGSGEERRHPGESRRAA